MLEPHTWQREEASPSPFPPRRTALPPTSAIPITPVPALHLLACRMSTGQLQAYHDANKLRATRSFRIEIQSTKDDGQHQSRQRRGEHQSTLRPIVTSSSDPTLSRSKLYLTPFLCFSDGRLRFVSRIEWHGIVWCCMARDVAIATAGQSP